MRHRKKFNIKFEDIISVENLLQAWREFLSGKRNKPDVRVFSRHLIDNIIQLHDELANGSYQHSGYVDFFITDPKLRHIHKAEVRDRLFHHAIYRQLYPFFDKTFIYDSYSCRNNKGTHKAINRFRQMSQMISQNNTKTCWILKCDIKKFFATINHKILIDILENYITDKQTMALLKNVIYSFENSPSTGLPLGNLTSQLFINVYMNKFDQFIKHHLKAKHYIRYSDDFVFFSRDKNWLVSIVPIIQSFLNIELKLELHPRKLSISTLASGVDFLGWVHFPHHRVLRTTAKRRMMKRIREYPTCET